MDAFWSQYDNWNNFGKICQRRSLFFSKKYFVSFAIIWHCCSTDIFCQQILTKGCSSATIAEQQEIKERDIHFSVVAKESNDCRLFLGMIEAWNKVLPSNKIAFIYTDFLLWGKNDIDGLFVHGSRFSNSVVLVRRQEKTLEREAFIHELSSFFFIHSKNEDARQWRLIRNEYLHNFESRLRNKSQEDYLSSENDPWKSSQLHRKYGFICNYSLTDAENDFNLYAQYFFSLRKDKKEFLSSMMEESEIAKRKFKIFERMMPTNVSF